MEVQGLKMRGERGCVPSLVQIQQRQVQTCSLNSVLAKFFSSSVLF